MHNKLLLYDTFNAKYLSYKDIVDSFVPNDEFFQLYGNNNILLMGPRGCGKTTLLKMISPVSQHYWKGEEAELVKSKIKFTSIYIPSDIQWKTQFDYLNKYLNDKIELVENLILFLFSSNIQIALCKTFSSIIEFGQHDKNDSITYEFEVCKELIRAWNIDSDTIPTFDDVELKILERISRINSIIKREIFRKEFDKIDQELPDYIFNDFFDQIKIGCKVFEKILKLDDDIKWALCFDELEIVPKFIQLKLLKYLRSVDQKFIFKLTTTPLFNLENNIIEASQGNDFSPIKLWVYDEIGLKRWEKFCWRLLSHRFEKRYSVDDFKNIFGNYNLDEIIREELNTLGAKDKEKLGYKNNTQFYLGTSKGSSIYFLFKRLSQTDKSFSSFLERRRIDSNEPFTNDELLKKSVFLKHKTEAVFRLIFKGRTRKTPPIHYGLPYLFEICDGNPRLVIGLIDEMLQNIKKTPQGNSLIYKQDQSKIIYNASERYFNLIQNHPDSTIVTTTKNIETNLALDILEKIGQYFQEKIIFDDFTGNTISTFRIDEDINHKYLHLLELALSLGAIIYLDPIESLSNTGVLGKRFRLSNFLAPKFKIPNRVNTEAKLSTILNKKSIDSQTKIEY